MNERLDIKLKLMELYTIKISQKRLNDNEFYKLAKEILLSVSSEYDNLEIDYMVEQERNRQDHLHPYTKHFRFIDWFMVISEEIGECIKAFNENNIEEFELELTQVMALNKRYNDDTGYINEKDNI